MGKCDHCCPPSGGRTSPNIKELGAGFLFTITTSPEKWPLPPIELQVSRQTPTNPHSNQKRNDINDDAIPKRSSPSGHGSPGPLGWHGLLGTGGPGIPQTPSPTSLAPPSPPARWRSRRQPLPTPQLRQPLHPEPTSRISSARPREGRASCTRSQSSTTKASEPQLARQGRHAEWEAHLAELQRQQQPPLGGDHPRAERRW